MINQTLSSIDYPELNLPSHNLKIIEVSDWFKIWDPLRKKYLVLTPEEYVRQSFIQMLIHDLHFPSSLIANEREIDLNGTKKRCDSILFSSQLSPVMIMEYKAPSVKITQEVFNQIVRYNMVLQAPFLTVSNGLTHFCCHVDYRQNKCIFLNEIPDYSMIKRLM